MAKDKTKNEIAISNGPEVDNTLSNFHSLVNSDFLKITNEQVLSLCGYIYDEVNKHEINNSMVASLMLLFSSIDDYALYVEDKKSIDIVEKEFDKIQLKLVEKDIEQLSKKLEDIELDSAMVRQKPVQNEATRANLTSLGVFYEQTSKQLKEAYKEKYNLLINLKANMYKVEQKKLVIKKYKDLQSLRNKILNMMKEFNITPASLLKQKVTKSEADSSVNSILESLVEGENG